MLLQIVTIDRFFRIKIDAFLHTNDRPKPYFYQMTAKLFEDKDKLYKEYLFDISPVSDEKPYFFNFFKYSKLKQLYESMSKKWEPFFEGGFIVIVLFIQALLLSLLFILLPIYTFKKIKKKGFNASNTHFSGTGIRSDIPCNKLMGLLRG